MKGASSLVIVFIIMLLSLVAVSWFRASTSSGTGLQSQIVKQTEIETLDYRMENTRLYLKTSIGLATQKGSFQAANYSGRKWKKPKNRYWMCKGKPQPATVKQARNATTNFTKKHFKQRAEEIHGIRNGIIYNIGKTRCIETGYNKPKNNPKNDHFTTALQIKNIQLSQENGKLKKYDQKVTLQNQINHNRYWYMYSILKKWVNQNTLKQKIKTQLAKVKDTSARTNKMCITDGSKCQYPKSYSCTTNHRQWVTKQISNGIRKEINKLESKDKYFGGNEIECGFKFNKNPQDKSYPGTKVKPRPTTKPINKSIKCGCNSAGKDKNGNCIDKPKWRYQCVKSWNLAFKTYQDITVFCRDTKYQKTPQKDLKNLKWRIKLNYKVTESSAGPSYSPKSCEEISSPPASWKPLSLTNQCNVQRKAKVCQTPVDTTGDLN